MALMHFETFLSGSAALGWVLLAGAVGWSLWCNQTGETSGPARWLWWLLLAGVLLAFRWPLIWLPHELYPDETQLLAGALTLRHDPMFWRSVDGGTAGPLDYYALLPASFFPGVASYAATRFTAAALIWGGLVAIGGTLALLAGRRVARLAVLPLLTFAAFTTSPEFVHYSTELVPGFLLAVALWLIARQAIQPANRTLWWTAVLLGAIPFSKLQAAPMAALLGLFLVVQELMAGRKKNLGLLLIGALSPVLAATLVTWAAGESENMLIPYFLQNLFYAQGGRQPLSLVLRQQWEQSVTNGYLALWLAGSAVFIFVGAVRLARAAHPLPRLGLLVAGLMATSLFCIFTPGRPYHHYLNLLLLPLCLLAGLVLAGGWPAADSARTSRARLWAGLFLLCTLLPQIVLRASFRPDPYAYYNTVVAARSPAHHELVATLRKYSDPGEALGLWGWRSSLYVEAGLRQATREAHTEFLFVTGPWQEFFLRRYMADLRANRPPVFVDAVGPGNFRFPDRKWAHEIFPRLHEWLDKNYLFLTDLDGTRLYVRHDRLVDRSPPPASP